jgi:hypothetical protein
MSRVKIENLQPATKDLDEKEMKKLYGGIFIVEGGIPAPVWNIFGISPIADCNGNCTVR